MLFQSADQLPLLVPARLLMDMPALPAIESLLRQPAVSQNRGISPLIGYDLYLVLAIPLDHFDLGGFLLRCRNPLRHQADMIRLTIFLPAEENQIPRTGNLLQIHRMVQLVRFLLQFLHPGFTVRFQRHILHTRIVQAEGNEHGIPLAIGISVPLSIPGIPLQGFSFFLYHIIPGTLRIPQLRLRNGDHILRPFPGQVFFLQRSLPNAGGFHICRRICITGGAVGMFLHPADQHAGSLFRFLKAGVRVNMLQNLRFSADPLSVFIIAIRCVLMEENLFFSTDKLFFSVFRFGIAACLMFMCFDFRKRTPQGSILVIAGIIMLVNDKIGISADKRPGFIITFRRMRMNVQTLCCAYRNPLRS